ncbi:sensor histidine kinase [Cucumibacter marinus]|uniref:sensor histidine kinase n=1 Tax=Cucumibacter marinus TaxID=1121252 RepID=UPI000491676B|nr:HAMP domain-containing sensor histidine kinase [Cucumibacter marinus]
MTDTPRVTRKWRPSLPLVIAAVLGSVLALSLGGVGVYVVLTESRGVGQLLSLGLVALGVIVATVVIGFVFARTLTGPVRDLTRASTAIRRDGRAAITPLPAYGTAEIAALSQHFFDLARHLVDRRDRAASFAAHVSHEFKSPVSAIRGAAELMREAGDAGMTEAERERFLTNIIADTARLEALLARLRAIAMAEAEQTPGPADIAMIMGGLEKRFDGLAITVNGPANLPLAIGEAALTAILTHLTENAAEHGANSLVVTVTREGLRGIIRIADNGTGVSPGNRERIFEPFFTTRREKGGTGMGLDITAALVAGHGGTIALGQSEAGAAFVIELPVHPGPER